MHSRPSQTSCVRRNSSAPSTQSDTGPLLLFAICAGVNSCVIAADDVYVCCADLGHTHLTTKEPSMKSGLPRRIGVLSVVVVTLLVGSTVLAQGPLGATNNPLAQMSTKLDQILAKLSPAAPEPGPVRLATGLTTQSADQSRVVCIVTNLRSDPLVVTVKLLDGLGAVATQTLPSLSSGASSISGGANVTGFFRCEFSFVGFANNVRANAQVFSALGGLLSACPLLHLRHAE